MSPNLPVKAGQRTNYKTSLLSWNWNLEYLATNDNKQKRDQNQPIRSIIGVEAMVENWPEKNFQRKLGNTGDVFDKNYENELTNGIKRALVINELRGNVASSGGNPAHQQPENAMPEIPGFVRRAISKYMSLPIHHGVFIPTIRNLGSPEQVEKWVPKARNTEIIGTYAQTELGHGSFLRGLETEAIYDSRSKEFRINCPKITSMKWWPGDMGLCATHAVVMAQVIIKGVKYGMHAFIVQIRDLDTHMPLPGVDVGIIGFKQGMNFVDNGYLFLKNVKVPRENMLSRYATVSEDGKYKAVGSKYVNYGSMLMIRVSILSSEALLPLQACCTIATRYSAVRRQGVIKEGGPEVSLLDYHTQQRKVLTQIAKVLSFDFTVKYVRNFYAEVKAQMDNGDFTLLPELHALVAGMKSYITESSLAGSEVCRRACGGHGYLKAAGLGYFHEGQMASVIYEGENTVMYLQCARYLLKCKSHLMKGIRITGAASYLNEEKRSGVKCDVRTADEFLHPEVLKECFKHRARQIIDRTYDKVQEFIHSGKSEEEAKNLTGIELVNMAKAHIELFVAFGIVDFFAAKRNNSVQLSAKLSRVLWDSCCLHLIHTIIENSGEFLISGYIDGSQLTLLTEAELQLLARLRPNAVALVDAFDFTDLTLRSALGSYDGNVYERLYNHAKNHPMNKEKVYKKVYELLKPKLLQGRARLMSNL